MPELPEVETVRRSLLPFVVGKKITSIEILHEKTTREDPQINRKLKGKTISDISRRGKLIVFHLDDVDLHLLCHLKMTGQLLYADGSAKAGGGHTLSKHDLNLPNRHTRTAIHFTDGSTLYYNDLRLFGYLKTVKSPELEAILASYGIEPGMDNFTEEAFMQALKKRKTNIKALLLNQSVISGLGNIYVDEACFYAGVRPTRNVQRLTKKEKQLLYEGSKKIIQHAVDAGGTTFYSFTSSDGERGNYFDELHVFSKEGQGCTRCKGTIKKIKHAGRGTHFCPECQK